MNIYDIAKKSGVSIATVSRAINGSGRVSEKTHEKIMAVMAELGYTPNVFARGLMINSMKTVGIMTIDVRDLYYAFSIHTIETGMRQKGYDIILCSTGEDLPEKRKYLKLLLQKRVDGIFLIGSAFKEKTDNHHIIEASRHIPIVMVNGNVDGDNIYSVVCDDSYGIYSATGYLAGKGHRKIAYVYDADTYSGSEKIKGFRKAVNEYGLESGPASVIKTSQGIDGGINAVDRLLNSGWGFTAIVASEDILAAGIMKRLAGSGRKIPDDVSVAGFNNSIISRCTCPELTTVDSKVEAISSTAAKLLIDAFAGKNIPSRTVLTPELIIRQST